VDWHRNEDVAKTISLEHRPDGKNTSFSSIIPQEE